MPPPTATALLRAWDLGQDQWWPDRALILLAAGDAHTPAGVWADLAIGERNRRLLLLRAAAFGPSACAIVSCEACRERLEIEIDLPAIQRQAIRSVAASSDTAAFHVEADGYAVRFRLPTTHDLGAILDGHSDIESATRRLLDRCVVEIVADGDSTADIGLPDEIRAAIQDQMAAADPMADIRLDVRCPACRGAWQARFDIVRFFWAEVHAWAVRLLRDVHALASAYGWREEDILALSGARRQRYLELIDT